MRTDLLDRYALLYARQRSAGIEFDYADENCYEIDCGDERVEGTTSFGVSGFFGASLGDELAPRLASLPWQPGPHQTGPVPLAVFVGSDDPALPPSFALTAIAIESLVKAFDLDANRLQGVVLPRRHWPERPPFRLPLRVGALAPWLFELFAETASRPWYADEPAVAEHGLRFEQTDPYDDDRPRDPWPDVLLVDSLAQLELVAKSTRPQRPRLFVACGFRPPIDHPALATSSCAVVDGVPSPRFVKALVYALIHDQPLHEMLKSAVREMPQPAHLIADPASVQQLRMLHAMQQLEDDAAALESSGYAAPADESPFEMMRGLRLDFGQEQEALVPMSRVRAALLRAYSVMNDRRAKAQFTSGAPRKVDVTVLRTDARSRAPLYVGREASLAAGGRYRVKVRIGLRSSASLVVGDVPAIDALLPETHDGGHLLHVVCYPLDFAAAGPTIQRLILPKEGPSNSVWFDVVAPRRRGPARLRIAVYYDADLAVEADESEAYRNHLIQSFRLETKVSEDGSEYYAKTEVTLEFSRVAGYAHMDEYTPRLASIAVNESPNGTHHLMMKRGGEHRSFSINPLALQRAVSDVRARLLKATALDENAQYPRFLETAPPNEAEFDAVIRDLAKAGAAMWEKIFGEASRATSDLLKAIAGTEDEIVQVVRLDSSFVFPWHVMYDFDVPDETFQAPPPPVCKKFREPNDDGTPRTAAQCLAACQHRAKNDAYCVYGFWGTRLQVEQTLHRPNVEETPIRTLDVRGKGVLVVSELRTNAGKELADELAAAVDPTLVEELKAPPELLEHLWSPARPAIVVIVGHYQTKPVPNEDTRPRVRVPGGWLIAAKILRSVKSAGEWTAPHPVVIMAACDSAGEDLLTMNGFVTAFAKARAGAFLGTETTVFEPLAREFALAMTKSLVEHRTLGASLLDFRRRLLQRLNPLGFIFSGYGDAELAWPKEAQS